MENDDSERAGAAHVCRVRAIDNGHASADVWRGAREESIRKTPDLMKEHSTAPEASMHGASWEDEAIFLRGAVVLPQTHCAFRRCGWTGASDEELRAHVVGVHEKTL